MAQFNLPSDSQRITIIGKTGSGKTQAAVWHLLLRRFDLKPWIIIDFKRDKLLNDLGAMPLDIGSKLDLNPGLYIIHPDADDTEQVEALLWRIWRKEKIGVYIDEGYMISPKSAAFQAILTQGRSKEIPVIILSQRPVWLSRFTISEADFIQTFWLTDKRDRETVQSFLPFSVSERLAPYNSHYYDVSQDAHFKLKPVPSAEKLVAGFRSRIRARKSFV